jgi:hypothetical protein
MYPERFDQIVLLRDKADLSQQSAEVRAAQTADISAIKPHLAGMRLQKSV